MTSVFRKGPGYEVICALELKGYEAVFVGGAVRDRLLGKQAEDIDIATNAEPAEVKAIFPHTIDVGLAHGTVLVLYNGEPIEVTTYRTEGTYTDYRHPDEVQFVRSLREDLLRRDFTMNAIALTKDGELIDPFDGREDMENRLIRAVGNPSDRFQEDALRMLRAIRFSSTLDFDIEKETFEAILLLAEQIRHVSVERIKMEMEKLILGENPIKAYDYIQKSGLHAHLPLFPNQLDHLDQVIPFVTAVEGWAYFAVEGNRSALEMTKAFKLSNSERKYIEAVKELYEKRNHSSFTTMDYYLFDLAVLKTVEKFYHAFNNQPSITTDLEIKQRKERLPIHSAADLAVNGKDLIQWTGCKRGRWIGEWLEKIEFAVLHEHCKNDRNTIREWFFYEFKREN